MIKKDLVTAITDEYGLSHNLSAKIVQTILDEIVHGLINNDRIELRRFGVFDTKIQEPRTITLPSGKKIKIPVQQVVTFLPSPTIKKKLNPKPKKK